MKKKLTRILTLVFALGAAWFARAAGDIYDIRPCDAIGTIQTGPVSSAVQPKTIGEPIYFAVRMMKRNMADAQWTLTYKGTGSEIVDDLLSPLKIGIYVSGQLKFASYTGVYNDPSKNVRDFVFSYTPVPGDFALPVKLATASGEADALMAAGEDPSYVLLNKDKWGFFPGADMTQAEADFFMMDSAPYMPGVPGAQAKDVSLAKAGFYLKGIDFDSEYAGSLLESPRVWRKIHQNGSTCVDMSLPSVVVPGNSTNAVSIYVWTVGTSVAYLDGNTDSLGQPIEVEYQGLSEDHVTPYAAKVAKIEVPVGMAAKPFKIRAVGAVGEKATVYMSAYPTNCFDKAGALIQNFVTRTIEIGEPEKPHLSIGFGAGEASALTLNADADFKTYKAELMCRLSSREDYTGPVTVKLSAKYADESGDLDLTTDENLVFSRSEKGAGWSMRADELTIPGGEETSRFYVYIRGADEHTSNGIILTATLVGEGADQFATDGATAELTVNPSQPKIAVPVQNQVYDGALTGANYPITDFKIEDTYVNLASDAGYTVYYKRTYEKGGDTKFIKLGTQFMPGLDGMAKDEDSLLSIKLAKAGTAKVQIYVVAPDGSSNKDDPRTFTVTVTQSPMVRAVIEKGLDEDGNVVEGELMQIRFFLSEENTSGGPLYAYLVPADEDSAANVDYCTALATKGSSGVPIPDGGTNSTLVAQLRLKDGTATGSLMNFTVILSEDSKLAGDPDLAHYPDTAGYEAYDGFGSESLNFFCINRIPTVRYVQMNGAEQVMISGNAFETKTSQGVENKFAVFAEEPSTIDLEATDAAGDADFFVRYTFYDGTSAPQVRIVPGNPNTMTGGKLDKTQAFTFQSAGRNRVVVALKDKDMDDYTDEAHSFTYYVDVNPTPGVQIRSGLDSGTASYLETNVGPEQGKLDVQLTMACDKALEVGLILERAKATDTFALPTLNLPTRMVDLDNDGTDETEVYVAQYTADSYTATTLIYFTFLDGTTASAQNGIRITPVILTDGVSTYGPTYKELYTFLTPYIVYPVNVTPTIIEPSEYMSSVTNKATIGVVTTRDWSVRDIEGDFAGPKAKVELTYEGKTVLLAQGAEGDDSTIADGGTYTYEFTSPGVKTVVITVTDKDGAQASREMIFVIDPSKNVYVYPHGQNTSAVTSLSTYYVNADGLGSGYVWRDKDTAKYTERHIYAFEQSASSAIFLALGDTSDWLGNGTGSTLEYDSFLYGWIVGTSGEGGVPTGTLVGLNPVRGKTGTYAQNAQRASNFERPVPLPSADEYDESANAYSDRYLEAIFSKEWRVSDNQGDINQDGIPDFFAVAKRYKGGVLAELASGGEGGGAGADGSTGGYDLVNLRAFNDDEDFLPAGTTAGNHLVPNLGKWDASGLAFMALHEIRGFGLGLNADGADLDYTANEQRAWLLFKGLSDEEALIAMGDAEVAALFEANKADAQADLDAKVWSPERPTDPTSADTDDDGLEDGFEYWFWYAARVGFTQNGQWSGLLKGRRLTAADIENFEEIPSADICAAFDPQVNNAFEDAADDFTAEYGNLMTRDFDCDGIYDLEEYVIGTSPVDCDTDGDGLPDGWEIMWGLNPLSADDPNGAGDNPDGDFMAYATSLTFVNGLPMPGATLVTVANHDDAGDPIVDGDGNTLFDFYLMPAFAMPGEVQPGDTIRASYIGRALTVDELVMTLKGDTIPKTIAPIADILLNKADAVDVTPMYEITLIHDQVYKYFGFDPRTAWSGGDGVHNYVTSRWCPICNKSDLNITRAGDAGLVVNTKAYTNYDEYLLGKYRGLNGGIGVNEDILGTLKKSCTNPNVPFEDMQYGDSEMVFSSTRHGADTSGDGVPDGWCLYVGGDPIVDDPPWGVDEDDGDGLSNMAEFVGTDTCGVYADCETIAEKAPTGGWVNKFFPTDPKSTDTDADGIADADEGAVWMAPYYVGRQVWPLAGFTFIYDSGDEDDGFKLCLRGGGMNPCSSDTDFDGLPDAWEQEYAGIVVTPAGTVFDTKMNTDEMYPDALKVADGFGTGNYHPTGNFIVGGMDATDGFDASTSAGPDTVVGTVRDRDFDHDGLENFQEYLVQSVRMWRYDDAETPLMGRSIIWTGDAGTVRLSEALPDASGCVPMHMLSGAEMMARVKASPLAANVDIADNHYYAGSVDTIEVPVRNPDGTFMTDENGVVVTETREVAYPGVAAFDYKAMGYMAPAEYAWDPMYQTGLEVGATYGYGYMRRPQAMVDYMDGVGPVREQGTLYVSTDPRQWDTDADGMDDFWEIFHGINPLLGNVDVVGAAYEQCALPLADALDGNVWGGLGGTYASIDMLGYDPILRPWRMGLPNADPDGDGLRNADEAINGNLTSPTTYHTDPTPLWMTDISSPMSYVAQYYPMIQSVADINPDFMLYPWTWSVDQGVGSIEGADLNALSAFGLTVPAIFSYEQTEGYDTDGDFRADGQEVVKSVMAISDPLDSSDPDRRAALYLPGEDACASSFISSHLPVVDAYDVFRQFTVECWVKPEESGREQTIVERGFAYDASNLVNDAPVWRANFRLAINEQGRVYGMFDNDNAVETGSDGFSSQQVIGSELPLEKWSHVALTFDGQNLSIYVNGQMKTSAKTGLIPANGILSVLQEPGSTNTYPLASYTTVPGANTIGARRAPTALVFSPALGFEQFQDFFKGYVSEVRFWDGARSQNEIRANYKVRMTTAEVSANRDEVFKAWADEATRSDVDGKKKLPPQLICLYNFAQLPAAVNAADVAQTPSGFAQVAANVPVDPSLIAIQWWAAMTMHSTVYTDYGVVPWVQNAVSRLPFLDDSFADSMYWSEPFAGNTAAQANGVDTYAIPNGGNPYKNRAYKAEADWHAWRLDRLAECGMDDGTLADKYAFQMRSEFAGLDDLLPLGGAFAKVDAEYWDNQGAATAWSDTGPTATATACPTGGRPSWAATCRLTSSSTTTDSRCPRGRPTCATSRPACSRPARSTRPTRRAPTATATAWPTGGRTSTPSRPVRTATKTATDSPTTSSTSSARSSRSRRSIRRMRSA